MDESDEYRAHAAECERMAQATIREDDKRQWLRLAQSWLGLIRTAERTPIEAFDAESRSKGTGQQESKASH